MSPDPVKARDIFLQAVEKHEPSQRRAFLDEACGDSPELRREVEVLLAAHERAGSFLENGAVAIDETLDQPLSEGPGTVIGPYKLLQEIGHGGMGVVFMAEQTEPVARRVALKIIKPGMDTRQVIARFEAERQALAMMDHPNIARVLDAGTTRQKDERGRMRDEGKETRHPDSSFRPHLSSFVDPGLPYFVMELVKGVPITQYCDEHHLTPRQRLELFVPVCQAVQHAHQKGIIHRDLKPSNVLVAEYDDRAVPKIIDFGVAKAIDQRLTEKTVFTQIGQVVGTIDYMSPEQAGLNQIDIDTRSDIYSLGVLLYELLTGVTPFDRRRLHSAAFDEMLRIIREEEPPKPSTRLSTIDTLPSVAANRQIEPKKLSTLVRGELDWIVMKALEKDRTRRYETANGFANDIQRYLDNEPVLACPPSAAYRFGKFARRNKAAMTTAALIAFTLILGLGGISWQAVRATLAEQQTRIEQQQTAKQRDRAMRAEAVATTEANQARRAAERAEQLATQEQSARRNAQRHLYDAHMSLLQVAYEQGRRSRMLELLGRYSSPSAPEGEDLRQFEWYYWWRQCHRYSQSIPRPEERTTSDYGLVVVSPDKATVAVVRELWSLATGQRIGTFYYDGERELFERMTALREALRNNPDNAPTKEQLDATWKQWAMQGRTIASTFSHDGTMFATLFHHHAQGTSSIHLFDAATLEPRRVIPLGGGVREHYSTGSRPLLFSPDDAWVTAIPYRVSQDAPQEIRVWNVATGEVRITVKPSGDRLPAMKRRNVVNLTRSLAFSPDGTLLATGGEDDQGAAITQLWDSSSGQQLKTLRSYEGHGGPDQLLFLPGGQRLLAQSSNDELTLWDLATDPIVPAAPTRIDGWLSPDGSTLVATGSHGVMELRDVGSGTQMASLSRYDQGISPDGQLRVTVDDDEKDLRVWDLSTDRLSRDYVRIPDIPDSWGYNLFAFSPDGRTIACCNRRGTVDLWDTATLSRGRIMSYGYFGPAVAVAFAPDGNSLASAGRDLDTGRFRIDLRDLQTGAIRPVGKHVHQITSLEFTRDGLRLASADAKGSLQVWDVASGQRMLADPPDQADFPEAVIFRGSGPYGFDPMRGDLSCSPDGTRVVLPKRPPDEKSARQAVFNVATGELEREVEARGLVVAYSPDGRLLAIGDGMEIRLVDCATWQVKGVLKGHMRFVNGLAFSPDGKRLASASMDQVILWNIATQTETLILAAPASWAPSCVAFSPDGRSLAVAGDREIRIYRGAHEQEVLAGRRQPEAISELERADACRRRNAWKEAIVHYTRAVEQSPDDDAGWWGRARCYAEAGELELALRDYQRVIELWRKLGVSFMSHCEYQGTRLHWIIPATVSDRFQYLGNSEYQGTQWDWMQELTQLAKRWETQGQPDRAIEVHRLAVQMWEEVCQKAERMKRMKKLPLRPESGHEMPRSEVTHETQGLAEAHRRLGAALARGGDPSAAEPHFRKSLDLLAETGSEGLNGLSAEHFQELARSGLISCLNDQARKLTFFLPPEQRNWQAAEALWRKAIELSTDGGGPHNNLGLALRARGDFEGAIGEFHKAIAYFQKVADAEPSNSSARETLQTARNNLATTYTNWSWALATAKAPADRDPAKAVDLARRAIELEPEDANHFNNLGVAQYRAGNWQAAVEWLDKADATIAGGDRAHRMFLAMAHWQLGNKGQARERYAEGAAWIASHRMNSEEQNRFRAEAEQLMEITPEERNRLVEEYLARPAEKKSDVPNER